jgi:coniferyl-aldehyde dehydrogenase
LNVQSQGAGPDLQTLLSIQQRAMRAEPEVPARLRIDRLQRAIDLLLSHQRELCDAAASDFGQRPATITRSMDILPAVLSLKYARRHLRRWMRPRRVNIGWPLGLPGARARIHRQPLGVVGLISPWNFPLALTFGPLAGILAAGNRCLVKPSELTPALSALIAQLVHWRFDASELAVVTGGPEVGQAFSRLPFDHLMFTGSTTTGQRVYSAAAEHLVPVTLELGGKCPAVVGLSASVPRAVDRILLGKLANAGQMCLAPDHVYLPAERIDAFIQETRRWMGSAYPPAAAGRDFTSMIDDRHAQRAEQLLADARAHGAELIPLTNAHGAPPTRHWVTPTLVVGATSSMRLMREEIFAPVLPLLPYRDIEQVTDQLSERAAALAIYYFGTNAAEARRLMAQARSGAVTINDVAMHFLVESLPFGGVGASGTGAYHGEYGFRRFSHERAVFTQTPMDINTLFGLRPPYGRRVERVLRWLLTP